MDKVSGLKSILRVVLPAGAVPKSDLISAAVSELDLIFFTIFTQPQQPPRAKSSNPSGAVSFHPYFPKQNPAGAVFFCP